MNGRNIKDITGKRFGRLVAQEPTELRRNGGCVSAIAEMCILPAIARL